MLTIGEMALAGNVSTQTLRYYDRIGLLKPLEVDQSNGYRYYHSHQLMTLRVISVLQVCGLSLKKIRCCIDQENISHIPEVLEKQLQSVEKEAEQLKLKEELLNIEINNLRTAIASESCTSPNIRRIATRQIISHKVKTDPAITPVVLAITHLSGLADKKCWPVYGKPVIINTGITGSGTGSSDEMEVGLCIKNTGTNFQYIRHIPGGEYATLYHRGSYNSIMDSMTLLYRWIRNSGHTPIDDPVTVLMVDIPMIKDSANLLSEIQIRLTL